MKKLSIIACCIAASLMLTKSALALCVTSAKANLRSGPGPNYSKTWEVYKYMPFEKVGVSVSTSWYAVKDVDGDIHWIYKNLVSENCRCAVVTKDNIIARTGPGTTYKRTTPADKYNCFQVIEKKGDWVKLRDELGSIVWLHSNYLWIQ